MKAVNTALAVCRVPLVSNLISAFTTTVSEVIALFWSTDFKEATPTSSTLSTTTKSELQNNQIFNFQKKKGTILLLSFQELS